MKMYPNADDDHPLNRYAELVRHSTMLTREDKMLIATEQPDEVVVETLPLLEQEVMDSAAEVKAELRARLWELRRQILFEDRPEPEPYEPRRSVSPTLRKLVARTGCLTHREKLWFLRELRSYHIGPAIRILTRMPEDAHPDMLRAALYNLIEEEVEF